MQPSVIPFPNNVQRKLDGNCSQHIIAAGAEKHPNTGDTLTNGLLPLGITARVAKLQVTR